MSRKGKCVSMPVLLCLLLLSMIGAGSLSAAIAPLASDGYIVKFKSTVSRAAQTNSLTIAGVQVKERFSLVPGLSYVQAVAGRDVQGALGLLSVDQNIEYIEPNYLVSISAIPNDPDFSQQWALDNQGQSGGKVNADIDAPQAWDLSTGNSIVVAVIDSGIDYTHSDIANNIWINTAEIPGNGIDDDNNGYVDDVRGWDFVNNDNDPMDDHGHGTHVAGIIAAEGNNGQGISGISWKARLVPLKFIDTSGIGSTVNAIRAINYAVAQGARLSNNSWGGAGFSQALYDTLRAAEQKGHMIIAASGNEALNNDDPNTPHYPSGYDLNNIISVAATDRTDNLAGFSNFGSTAVDLGAPGVRILSLIPNNRYQMMDGTSMAAPVVTGVASLVLSRSPDLPLTNLRTILLSSVDAVAALNGITVTGGRINAFRALSSIATNVEITPQTLNIGVNQTHQFNVTGGSPPYQWSVSRPTLAQVDNNGFFQAFSAGTVQLTVTDSSGGRGSTGNIVISDLTVTPQSAELLVGDVLQFGVAGGVGPYVWSTSPNGVGQIDPNSGLFSALSQGLTDVTVSDSLGISRTSGSIRVLSAQLLTLTPMRADMMPGEVLTFSVNGGIPPYQWQVSDRSIAMVDNLGNVTALGNGSFSVTVTDGSGNSVTSNNISVSELSISSHTSNLRINESVALTVKGGTPPFQWRVSNSNLANIATDGTLTAVSAGSIRVTIMDANGTLGKSEIILITESSVLGVFLRDRVIGVNSATSIRASGGVPPYQWRNSNPAIVKLDEATGIVTGLSAGQATITITDSLGETVVSDVIEVRTLAMSPANYVLETGQSVNYSAAGGLPPYRWQSNNMAVASVDAAGLVSALAPGLVKISVTDADGIQMSTELTVIAVGSGLAHPMDIRPATATLSRRSTNVLQFTVSGGTAPYSFSLSNPSVGSINAITGEYAPLSDIAGETQVIVSDADGHVARSGVVSVQ